MVGRTAFNKYERRCGLPTNFYSTYCYAHWVMPLDLSFSVPNWIDITGLYLYFSFVKSANLYFFLFRLLFVATGSNISLFRFLLISSFCIYVFTFFENRLKNESSFSWELQFYF